MLSTLQRLVPFLGRASKERATEPDNVVSQEAALTTAKDESNLSENWMTVSHEEDLSETPSDHDVSAKETTEHAQEIDGNKRRRLSAQPNKISKALSHLSLRVKKEEFVVDEDISNGREHLKIPAYSYKRNDRAPSDYHYVIDHIQYEPVSINQALTNMASCNCVGDCSDGSCYCSSGHKTGRSYDSKSRLNSQYNVDAPEIIYECNAGCSCNKKSCQNMVIQHGSKIKVALIRTKTRGWGIRTLENLKRGTFVGVYSGELISANSSYARQDDTYLFNLANTHDTKQAADGDDHYVCDAKFYGNFTRFINHSCQPNVIGIRTFTVHQDEKFPYISFFTNKDISENSELTLNYGDNYWLVKCKRDKVYCLCKAPGCRFSRRTFPRTFLKPGNAK